MRMDPTGMIRAQGEWIRKTMEEFATSLNAIGQFGIKQPVIDGTGLNGKYDLSLNWTLDIGNAPPIPTAGESGIPTASHLSAGPSVFTALQKQLGLKLVPKKVVIEILVIDHIEKTPTEH